MTDRVYPSSKPNGTTTKPATANANGETTNGTAKPRLPAPPKSHLYDPSNPRHPYRLRQQQQPAKTHRRRRRCLCLCCFWSILIIIAVLLLAAIAGCILYVLFRPQRPTFSVTALKFSQFNLTTGPDDESTSHLTAKLNLTLSAKNPNKKLIFIYDSISITCLGSSNPQVQIANGSFPDFVSNPNNITIIRSSLYSNYELLELDSVNSVRADLKKKKKSGLPLKIVMDLGVRVKMDSLRSKKIGIRINCDGIHSLVPDGNKNSTVAATIPNAKCKVDLRIKIWKYWTF